MKIAILKILGVTALISILLVSCGSELPENVKVDIIDLHAREITFNELQSAFSGNDLVPPFYDQSMGTKLYGIVIRFHIETLFGGAEYNIVNVHMNALKDEGGSGYPENVDVNIVTAIPMSVERTSDRTEATKFAANITATIKALSGTVGGEQTSSESYQKIYRSVSAHITPHKEVYWEFTPFLDEPVQSGTYYLITVVEIPNGTTGNLFLVSAGCSYASSSLLGMSSESSACTTGASQKIYIP